MTVITPLADRIVRAIRDRPQQFAETVDAHRDVPWPEFLRAWGEVRAQPTKWLFLGPRFRDRHCLVTSSPLGFQSRAHALY